MKSKLVADNAGERTYVLVLDPGEEAFKTIGTFDQGRTQAERPSPPARCSALPDRSMSQTIASCSPVTYGRRSRLAGES